MRVCVCVCVCVCVEGPVAIDLFCSLFFNFFPLLRYHCAKLVNAHFPGRLKPKKFGKLLSIQFLEKITRVGKCAITLHCFISIMDRTNRRFE